MLLCSTLDYALGYFLFGFLFLLSFLFVIDKIQGALLFNMRFAKALEVRACGRGAELAGEVDGQRGGCGVG